MEILETWVTILGGLSVANERLVEIIKNMVPQLSAPQPPGSAGERHKSLLIHVLSIICGIATIYLCALSLGDELVKQLFGADQPKPEQLITVGVLVGAGSGFWNAFAGYVAAVKKVRDDTARRGFRAAPPTSQISTEVHDATSTLTGAGAHP